jgi:hypothetical protein
MAGFSGVASGPPKGMLGPAMTQKQWPHGTSHYVGGGEGAILTPMRATPGHDGKTTWYRPRPPSRTQATRLSGYSFIGSTLTATASV